MSPPSCPPRAPATRRHKRRRRGWAELLRRPVHAAGTSSLSPKTSPKEGLRFKGVTRGPHTPERRFRGHPLLCVFFFFRVTTCAAASDRLPSPSCEPPPRTRREDSHSGDAASLHAQVPYAGRDCDPAVGPSPLRRSRVPCLLPSACCLSSQGPRCH